MKIRCVRVALKDLRPDEVWHVANYVHLDEVQLEIGGVYSVYGIIFRSGIPWFYVCDGATDDEYPVPQYCGFFEVIDATVSSSWKIYFPRDQHEILSILPARWGDNSEFYENLIDGKENEALIFRHIKESIDAEGDQ